MSTTFTTNLPNIAISKIGIGQLVSGSSPNVINISEGTAGQLLVSGGAGGTDYWADGSSVLGADVILVGGNSPSSTLSFGAITDQAVSILQNNQQVIGISAAQAVTIGASGGTQTHTVNGDFRLVKASTTSDGPRLRLESTDTNIAANEYIGTIDFYTNDGSGAGAGVCASIRGISINTAALTDIVISTGDTTTQTQALKATYDASVVVGAESANATTATAGFLYIPTCAGTPTGVPRAITGKVAMVFDTTNNELYVYDGGWISVALA